MTKSFSLLLLCLFPIFIIAQIDSTKLKTKKGFSMGGVPVVAYNSDKGFMYGLSLSLYNFGDGSYYPNNKQSLYLEWSRTTNKNQLNQAIFDLKDIFDTKLRLLSEISYITDKLLPFYGFNGYDANYNANYENDVHSDYISRAYYRIDRSNLRILNDFQAPLKFENFRWVAGFGYLNYTIKTVDINLINSTLDEREKLPDVPTLYDEYVNHGIIPDDQKKGGEVVFGKAGIVYDTRNIESNPSKGIWAEAVITGAPSFLNKASYIDLTLLFRHYFELFIPHLTMANRIGYQSKLTGEKPFYVLPYLFSSYVMIEAFGGVKTIRGILANRIIGEGVAFGNFEFRYKFLNTRFLKQDFYISANTFLDWGMVIKTRKVQNQSALLLKDPIKDREKLHFSTGAGLRFAFNQNFIIAIDYGKAIDPKDGDDGLYIALDFLY